MAPSICTLCARPFPTRKSYRQHVRDSPAHIITFHCDKCNRNFETEQALQQHLNDLPGHITINTNEYDGIASARIRPIYSMACRLRYKGPEASHIMATTGTTLDREIVSAIIEGALRLVPQSADPAEAELRLEKIQLKQRLALLAETDFVTEIRRLYPSLLDEAQQKQENSRDRSLGVIGTKMLTPDILFYAPNLINGVWCHWMEYKNYFGFKFNPFVHRKNRRQYQDYADKFGSGMVVYKLGYEKDLLQIPGVTCCRETEVINWVRRAQDAI